MWQSWKESWERLIMKKEPRRGRDYKKFKIKLKKVQGCLFSRITKMLIPPSPPIQLCKPLTKFLTNGGGMIFDYMGWVRIGG